jgi:hypothetical protein
MLKTFAQMAKKNFQSGHTDFQRKTDLGWKSSDYETGLNSV